ncbi:MAG: response regulator, partial [Chloroflexota bacterium]
SMLPLRRAIRFFEKYFQGSIAKYQRNHFGLGLTFSKNLIALLKGSIEVESTVGQGTTFTCVLPVSNPAAVMFAYPQKGEHLPGESYLPLDSSPLPSNAPWLLIVEDNPGILSYLQTCLQPFFHLLLASNGQEGIDIANQKIPDLILTDLLMPILDGLSFSQAIKTNPLTNHIPIVMLSAKTEIHDRVSAQQHGADLFLGKPFHSEELILSLQNLYRLQQNWKGKFVFAQDIETGSWNIGREIPSQDTPVHPDHAFMEAILDAFEKNYISDSFDVQQLCKTLHLSKTQLYRKLSAISNESAMEMLRNFRLQKAAFMLKNNPEISVKEIAYLVGIKELSHFSNLFKKRYGVSPTEMRKQ